MREKTCSLSRRLDLWAYIPRPRRGLLTRPLDLTEPGAGLVTQAIITITPMGTEVSVRPRGVEGHERSLKGQL